MKLDDLSETEYGRVLLSIHEAAHAVMGVLAGAEIGSCVASAAGGRVDLYGEDPQRAAGIAWAGPFAELLFVHGDHPPEDAVRQAFAEASPEDRALMDGGRYRAAESDIRFAMPAIRRLALRLHKRGSARNLDVHRALGVRPGVDIGTVRWAYRQRIDPAAITPAGAAA
ncbi:hypothetical protein [Nocardia wallacei]|uniref:hypothetical protein n=1 Tax=Nocardia wallacei TaxID=480035 RepID=UPI002455EB7E|nr:hypothetical protein [Nocardia wallacei]